MAISDTSRHTTEFSSSEPMVERIRSDSVLALGKKLVDELGLDQSVDTLGRWMAHYIAEKWRPWSLLPAKPVIEKCPSVMTLF